MDKPWNHKEIVNRERICLENNLESQGGTNEK